MAITLTQATTAVTNWVNADIAISKGQSYTIGDRTLTRVHASEVRNMIQFWSRKEAELQRVANGESSLGYSTAKFS